MQVKDEKLTNTIGIVRGETGSNPQIETACVLKNKSLYRKTKDAELAIPKAVRWRIAKYCHYDVGHYGLEKSLERVQQKFLVSSYPMK